jgi:two-component system, NarL family, sensor kinase
MPVALRIDGASRRGNRGLGDLSGELTDGIGPALRGEFTGSRTGDTRIVGIQGMSTTDRVARQATSKPRMAIPAPGTGYRAGLGSGSTPQRRLDRLRQRLRSSEQLLAADALARERGRIAADVHDLVMQDLAFALAAARTLAADPALAQRARTVVEASERALAGAREVVEDLVNHDRPSVIEAVRGSVCIAARHVPLTFDADGVAAGGQPDRQTLHALVHIGREAVTNAIKHADPDSIEVVLDHAEEWCLRVSDHGHGFDMAAVHGGFGLQSMRRQAHALGGKLLVRSTPGLGTTVEAVLP